jgi:hypothetical protein
VETGKANNEESTGDKIKKTFWSLCWQD